MATVSATLLERKGTIADISSPSHVSPGATFSVSLTVRISVDTSTSISLWLQQLRPYVYAWVDNVMEKVRGDFEKKYTLSATAPTQATYVRYYVRLSYLDEGGDEWHMMDEEVFFLTTYVPWKKLEGDHIVILLQAKPPKAEQVDHALALLPYLDRAYEFLRDWTGNTPYRGLKIGIVYNSSIVDEFGQPVGGLAGNPIEMKDYPTADTTSALQPYLHELSHDFTADDLIRAGLRDTSSVREGFAELGRLYINYRFGGEFAWYLSVGDWHLSIPRFLDHLRDYEEAGSPFSEVRWNVPHPREEGEHPSDRLCGAILLAMAEVRGWGFVSRLFSDVMERVDMRPVFGDELDLVAEMNSLVYLLSLAMEYDLTSIFAYWHFPLQIDSDDDGLTDGKEIGRGLSRSDFDEDGLTDDEELTLGTRPYASDSDDDELKDGEEVTTHGTDPLKVDTDGDGLNDGDEVRKCRTDPLRVDTDGDGLGDGDETERGTDPLRTDTDNDGWNDSVDPQAGNPLVPNAIAVVAVVLIAAGLLAWRVGRGRKPSRVSTVSMTPRYSPTQTTLQPRTLYTPEQVGGMLRRVEERYNAGEIDRSRYEQLLEELVFQDAYGRWWTIDHRTGKWVQQKNGTWVEAEPPPWLQK